MLYCKKCNAKVRGTHKQCPLCQSGLAGEMENAEQVLPLIPSMKQRFHLFLRVMVFCSISAVVVCFAVNYMFSETGWWSLFVVAGVGCMWLSIVISINKRKNIPKMIVWQVVIIALLGVAWDYFTYWHRWSIDYVIPFACICGMIAMSVLSKVLKLRIQDYMIYLVIDGLFGIIPLVFLLTDMVRVMYPSIICVAGSIISLVALLSFQGENMHRELKRRLHL